MECSVEDCHKRASRRGWCDMHYRRWQRNGDVGLQPFKYSICQADGCGTRSAARVAGQRLCGMHAKRLRRRGSLVLPATRKEPVRERVLRYFDEGDPAECWPWKGQIETTGYGRIRDDDGRLTTATRIVYRTLVGPFPEHLTIDHVCRNRACVNPAHLEPVTQAVNNERKPPSARCPNGHDYTVENTIIGRQGRTRTCRTCTTARLRRYRLQVSAMEASA